MKVGESGASSDMETIKVTPSETTKLHGRDSSQVGTLAGHNSLGGDAMTGQPGR